MLLNQVESDIKGQMASSFNQNDLIESREMKNKKATTQKLEDLKKSQILSQ